MKIVIEEMANGKFRVVKLTERVERGWFKSEVITDRELLYKGKLAKDLDKEWYHWGWFNEDSYAWHFNTFDKAKSGLDYILNKDQEEKNSKTVIKTHEVKI